jgi:hypothetical protein
MSRGRGETFPCRRATFSSRSSSSGVGVAPAVGPSAEPPTRRPGRGVRAPPWPRSARLAPSSSPAPGSRSGRAAKPPAGTLSRGGTERRRSALSPGIWQNETRIRTS